MTYRHGLVIGKFYPPHAGHHHLIDTAAAACDRVTVVAAASTVESIPLALRAAWLRERHPQPNVEIVPVMDDVEVDYDSDEIWAAHVAAFRTGLEAASGQGVGALGLPPVDAVFSSEAYGPELARRFAAAHVPVDPPRDRFPVSGTAVRRDPVACWEWLAPAVRAYLARRVVVLGAESSGTTTLSRALAAHYSARGGVWAATRWVPEYGRVYCEEKLAAARRTDPGLWIGDLDWSPEEFTLIAERHLALEDAAARSGSPLLICDTDAFATSLWHERYLGALSPDVERVHARARHDLWILTDTAGVPFEQDGWRDGESIRERMSARFREELDRRALPYVIVTGAHEDRLATAVAAIDALLDKGWTFTAPL
ncbi:AAA family ATPase [Actinoallomurus soli]|uniref:AAA family ATPase n=1 Tax=Actinoallomurus soli TaxID=2952535 RepID=UPI002092CA1E|nr:AAA family ATPase [Actinoallomurus soli]MCO5970082.1 AAA family ATPase [Actinoallomurus soli]